jgi:hypothetical protein
VTFCVLARSFLLFLALKPPSLSFFQDRFRLEDRQVILLSAVSDRTQGAAQLRRQLAIRHGVQQFVLGRGLEKPSAAAYGGRDCKMHDAWAALVQVAMVLHPSALTKGDAQTP